MHIEPIAASRRAAFYRTIWRWHFYAGLFVIPFILILSLTGAIYLFKPQIERWEESAFRGLPTAASVVPTIQMEAALSAYPGSQFYSYRLPAAQGDAAMIHLAMADGKNMRDVFVSPQGKVLGSIDPDDRIARTVSKIHGTLLAGRYGSWLVELAASWAIVMILSGLYLWWPRGRGLAGVVWPRLRQGKAAFWRDLHAVTGFWVSGLALILLISGLPWTSVWGDAFQVVRNEMGWVQGARDWKTSEEPEHADHDHAAMLRQQAVGTPLIGFDAIVSLACKQDLPNPIMIKPPGAPQRFGALSQMAWTISSENQNRPVNRILLVDVATGRILSDEVFSAKHPIDKIVGYGVAWHEGALLGWVNQLIGLLTAVALITLAISGFILWRRRRPDGELGAPVVSRVPARMAGVMVILFALAALLPLLAASLIVLWLFDRLILPRLPSFSHWLGVRAR
ncbi:MAG: PepSY-associated TM helix domain-containing protein [Sphingorhabdus sp.]